jgi:hypothetical protein
MMLDDDDEVDSKPQVWMGFIFLLFIFSVALESDTDHLVIVLVYQISRERNVYFRRRHG